MLRSIFGGRPSAAAAAVSGCKRPAVSGIMFGRYSWGGTVGRDPRRGLASGFGRSLVDFSVRAPHATPPALALIIPGVGI